MSESLHDISRLIGQLEAKVEQGNLQRANHSRALEDLHYQHTDLKRCIEKLNAAVDQQSTQIQKIGRIADEYTILKNKGIGILMVLGVIFAALWEGLKIAFRKFGG